MRGLLSTRATLATSVAVLAGYQVARRTIVPDELHFATNTAMIGVIGAVAWAGALEARELGLSRSSLAKGLRYGAAAVGVIGAVVVAGSLLRADPGGLRSDRAAVDASEMLFKVFVRIPIGTVLLEELAFRGLLAALFERLTTPARALGLTALGFGLWHVSPLQFTSWAGTGDALATIAATTAAGVGFHLLKRRSGSLAAPGLAHWGTNGVSFLAAWVVTRAIR